MPNAILNEYGDAEQKGVSAEALSEPALLGDDPDRLPCTGVKEFFIELEEDCDHANGTIVMWGGAIPFFEEGGEGHMPPARWDALSGVKQV